jgi:hypothetical protein
MVRKGSSISPSGEKGRRDDTGASKDGADPGNKKTRLGGGSLARISTIDEIHSIAAGTKQEQIRCTEDNRLRFAPPLMLPPQNLGSSPHEVGRGGPAKPGRRGAFAAAGNCSRFLKDVLSCSRPRPSPVLASRMSSPSPSRLRRATTPPLREGEEPKSCKAVDAGQRRACKSSSSASSLGSCATRSLSATTFSKTAPIRPDRAKNHVFSKRSRSAGRLVRACIIAAALAE